MEWISVFSTLVTFVFTWAVYKRYRQRGGTHLLLWAFGLLLYGVGTLSEALMLVTYHPWLLKIWYLTGAMLTAAWLGQGSIHLLVRRGAVAPVLAAVLALASLVSAVLLVAAPLNSGIVYELSEPVSSQYKEILQRSGAIVLLTILLNIYGTLGLVGGALYSAFLFWRKRILAERMFGNILIAAGALMPAFAGSLIKAGLADWLYVSEFLGASLMYLGFVRATASQSAVETPRGVAATSPQT